MLLTFDGVTALFDGVCDDFSVYEKTPENIKNYLMQNPPDIVAYTHTHKDHYDQSFITNYEKTTLRSAIGPEGSLLTSKNNVTVKGIYTRHIGSYEIDHVSFVIEADKCVWFMGDASPSELKKLSGERKPDILIAPYAYANTASSWSRSLSTGAEKIIILHLPDEKKTNMKSEMQLKAL